jgi:hypothetical protein
LNTRVVLNRIILETMLREGEFSPWMAILQATGSMKECRIRLAP